MPVPGSTTVGTEAYSDGSLSSNAASRFTPLLPLGQFPADWVQAVRKSQGNQRLKKETPTPSQLWLLERKRGAPWREEDEAKIQLEDAVTKKELEKRFITLLAKQTSEGLRALFGVVFDATELIPLLEKGRQDKESTVRDSKMAALFTAALRFDIKNVLKHVEMTPKNTPIPRLTITRRSRDELAQQRNLTLTAPSKAARGAGNRIDHKALHARSSSSHS